MLIRQLVQIEMSVSATAVDFREQLLSGLFQNLVEPSFCLGLLARNHHAHGHVAAPQLGHFVAPAGIRAPQ